MIPTLILVSLVFGRWWRTTLVVAAVGWPVLLLADGTVDADLGLVGVAAVGAINAGVGVLVHQAVLWAVRRSRRDRTLGVDA